MIRFAGFELDRQRGELRGPDGDVIKLRPKTFDMLQLFVANPGRTLSKPELMKTVWPDVIVGEDSLFQCIREIRTALGDEQRQLIKLVSGRGYLFDSVVTSEPADLPAAPAIAEHAKTRWPWFALRGPVALGSVAALGAIIGLAVAMPLLGPGQILPRTPPTVAVMPIVDASNDSAADAMAAGVTERLIDGLARIDNIRVVKPQADGAEASAKQVSSPAVTSDYVVTGELRKDKDAWTLQARIVTTATKEIQPVASVTVEIKNSDTGLQEQRLAAGIGQPLALRLNTLLNTDARSNEGGLPPGSVKAAIEQATASIMQTSRERFAAAQTMLESAMAEHPDNVDLAVALAGLQMRGVQMAWYNAEDRTAAEKNTKLILERLLRAKPNHIQALESYCRFLNATNQFVESLVACARTLNFDPWNGLVLYHIGLAQLQLGRFDDALATFKQADRFDTPPVSRWTWLVGAGWACAVMDRDEEAVAWLQRSIAITPASGRPLMLLAVAYHRLGRLDDAKDAMAKGLEMRPGTTALNVAVPAKNASPVYLAASDRLIAEMVKIGLPER
ncbi:MAG: winged helix-turn-helix domain-containing protein [Pseudolabrys sp.]|nr:winged helix-turn-helix domain-containing protein [Pseudolabrys sp.]